MFSGSRKPGNHFECKIRKDLLENVMFKLTSSSIFSILSQIQCAITPDAAQFVWLQKSKKHMQVHSNVDCSELKKRKERKRKETSLRDI